MRPFLPRLTKSELHAVMTGGFATVSGSYIALLIQAGVNNTTALTQKIRSCRFYNICVENSTKAIIVQSVICSGTRPIYYNVCRRVISVCQNETMLITEKNILLLSRFRYKTNVIRSLPFAIF
jgi:hypothetical protein